MFGTLGTQLVAHRDVPRLINAGHRKEAVSMLAQCVVVSSLVAPPFALIAPILGKFFDLSIWEVMLALCHGFVSQAFLTLVIESKSRLAMIQYARDMLLRSALVTIAGAGAAFMGGGGQAVVFAEAFLTLLMLPFLSVAIFSTSGVRWSDIEPFRIRDLPWRTSIVLLAGAIVSYGSCNADRWVAASVLKPLDFGHYSFAWIPLLAAQSVQWLLNAGIFPLLVRREAILGPDSALRLTAVISLSVLALSTVGAFIVWAVAGPLIQAWLPKYLEALPILPPLLGAAAFRVSDFWSNYLIVSRSEGALLKVQIVGFSVVFIGWALVTEPSYTSVAWLAFLTAAAAFFAGAVASMLLRATWRGQGSNALRLLN
jgi:O-antigen/teichoic acid export membrane protein